jgi:hypothetical protein
MIKPQVFKIGGRTSVITVPHATMIAGSHIDGRIFFRIKFEGGSKAQ